MVLRSISNLFKATISGKAVTGLSGKRRLLQRKVATSTNRVDLVEYTDSRSPASSESVQIISIPILRIPLLPKQSLTFP